MSLNKVVLCLSLILLSSAQCPVGQGQDDQGQCVPCTIQHCGFCDGANSQKCISCIGPYELSADQSICQCPVGQGPVANGGCGLCLVMNCATCSDSTTLQCQVCKPNFSNLKTDTGNQCICESPFILNSNGQCTCPSGYGLDSIRGCAPCDITNCQTCNNSDSSTCSKCFNTARMSDDGSKCSCPPGEGPASNFGCAPCLPKNCETCDNALVNRCNTCKQNFAKIIAPTQTKCVCTTPFIMTPSGDCVCPPGQGPDGQGGCKSCAANCDVCSEDDYDICKVCKDSYQLNEDGTQCQCPDGYGKTAGKGCQPCSVSNCKFCQDASINMCSICNDNFLNFVTGNSSQCTCQSPFLMTQDGACICPIGQVQDGANKCVPCSDQHCQICSSPDKSSCQVCADTYVLKFDEQSQQMKCMCPQGQGPLNGGKCTPCADSDCLACDNSALNLCKLCRTNFTNFIISYNNSTLEAEASQCDCQESFILTSQGNCVCPVGTTLDITGKCKKCGVQNCQNCLSKNKKCESCFSPFILSQDGTECKCPNGQVFYNGVCTPCSVQNCLRCDNPNVDNCNLCEMNFTLTVDQYQSRNQTQNITIETATCLCDDPFELNDDGTCTCPSGLMLTQDGKCLSCMIDDCQTCSSPYVCSTCKAPFELNADKSMCTCPQGQGKTNDGGCGQCSIDNCGFCLKAFSNKCISCQSNYTLTQNNENSVTNDVCLCMSPFIVNTTNMECVCPFGSVYNQNGSCDVCRVYNCKTCSDSSLLSCLQCFAPYTLSQDGHQCVCPPGQTVVEGGCAPCSTQNCIHCPLATNQCFACSEPYVLNNKGLCVCPPGSVLNQYGICAKCSVQNCAECNSATATTCNRCHAPAKITYDYTRCQCPYGQSVLPEGGCAPCSVNNCQRCENAVLGTCLQCKPSFIMNSDSSECQCPPSQGPNGQGYCQSCKIQYCTECYQSALTCSVCIPPYISNDDGTACICPPGQGSNSQGGCAKCIVQNCAVCPSASDEVCQVCYPTLDLSSDGTSCIPSNQFQACELGRGLNENNICDTCKVNNCQRCYASLQTCSICTSPFVSNSDGSKCVCPRGQSSNGAGGCSYCKVDNCQSCSSAQSYTCDKCFSPFVLGKSGLSCEQANQDLFDQLENMISKPLRRFSEQFNQSFGSGLAIGILSTILIAGITVGLCYYFNRPKRNNSLMEDQTTSRSFYAEMQLPSHKA